MKQLPRIYSLSTVGLIYHQDIDFLFHELRTDFVGDSGSGKSIIADLLQLILVGSDKFEAATQSIDKEPRKPNGLLIDSKGVGYAFINIEIEDNKYIVIGTIIEKNSTSTKSFIIQKGTDFTTNTKLIPFEKPIKANDFVKNNRTVILLWQDLKEHFYKMGLGFKEWSQLDTFLTILSSSENEIIPFNFEKNKNALSDYANIIRSFARGNKIDAKNSNSLKEFLFGKNDEQEILKRYNHEKNQLEKSIKEYGQHKTDIKQFTRKLDDLKDLKQKANIYEQEYKKWLFESFSYWYGRRELYQKKYQNLSEQLLNSFIELSDYSAQIRGINDNINTKIDVTKQILNEKQAALKTKKERYDKLNEIETWLKEFRTNLKGLEKLYYKEREKEKIQNSFNELKIQLKNEDKKNDLWDFFQKSGWSKGFKEGHEWHVNELKKINSEIQDKETLLLFSDLSNPNSLGNWAINNLEKPISHEFESIIRLFQAFPREKQPNKERFLANPVEIFSIAKIKDTDKDGFWLDLSGIWEFIKFSPNQILNTTDPNTLKDFIDNWSVKLKEEKDDLAEKKQKMLQLYEIFENSQSQQWINAFINSTILIGYSPIKELKKSPEYFKERIAALQDREIIEKEFNTAVNEENDAANYFKNLTAIVNKVNPLLKSINDLITFLTECNDYLSEKSLDKLKFIENSIKFDENSEFVELIDSCQNGFDKVKRTIFTENQWQETVNKLSEANNEFDTTKIEFEEYFHNSDIEYPNIAERPNPKIKDEALTKYSLKFEAIIKDYIPDEEYKFVGINPDFNELSKTLFSSVKFDEELTKEGIISQVERELQAIIYRSKDISQKKLDVIKTILISVETTISSYNEISQEITKFFNRPENKISRIFIPQLTWIDSEDDKTLYPIGWLSEFIEDVSSGQLLTSLIDRTESEQDIDKKLIKAFEELTGIRTLNPKITDLLSPFSYFKLSFDMESEHGRKTKGSTGQAYSAIALLCIARLSIIEKNRGKKVKGIRFMAIDEAEVLGSNYDILYEIAKKYDYQIITLSINIFGSFSEGSQYLYMLQQNTEEDAINFPPYAIFNKSDRSRYETKN